MRGSSSSPGKLTTVLTRRAAVDIKDNEAILSGCKDACLTQPYNGLRAGAGSTISWAIMPPMLTPIT